MENERLIEEHRMLLDILSLVDAEPLADALHLAGYNTDITIPLLLEAGADLTAYCYCSSGEDE